MEKIRLGENGPEVSPVIYSFWRALEDPDGISYRTVQAKLNACLDFGITTFDHADIYGNYQVEELFGKAIKESNIKREDIVISTKYGINNVDKLRPEHRTRYYDSSPEHLFASLERSLKNLGTDYVDILLLHHPDPLMDADETASALTLLVKKGLVKHIGVANFTVHQHQLLQSRLSLPIITNHLELNLLNTKPITDGTIDFIKQQYSRPLAWAPLAGGRLQDINDESTINIRSVLKRIALWYDINEEQLAIAWLLKLGALPIVGSNSIARIKNATTAVTINLDKQDWYEIYFAAINSVYHKG
ncbi:MAG: aldo/keto reductase [Bacteroidota bacterium]